MPWKLKTVPATTNNLTKAIINDLLSKGHSASRINTQGQWDEQKGIWRKSGSRNGFFDIAACIFGRAVVIDIKKGDDHLRKEQIAFKKEWIAAGGLAEEFGTKQEYDAWYKNIFAHSINSQTGIVH